jgi:hypothetical protein
MVNFIRIQLVLEINHAEYRQTDLCVYSIHFLYRTNKNLRPLYASVMFDINTDAPVK